MAFDDLFAVLDYVPTPVFVMDVLESGLPVYAFCNRATLARIKRPMSDFTGLSTVQAYGSAFGQPALDEQRKTILAKTQRSYEFELPFGNGLGIVRTTLNPLMDSSGRVYRLIGSSQDISAEWIAQRAKVKQEIIGNEIEQFVTMAAHDLRAPMRNVSMLAEMLSENFEDQGDGKVELINLLEETSVKSLALIDDIMSHACAISAPETREQFDLHDLTVDLMQVLDPQNAHRMTCASVPLLGEKSTLQIILRNLIENAIKHGARDSLMLQCSARIPAKGWIEVTLDDDGAGFANPGHAFLDTGTFRVDSGYGLLGIRRLISARNGTIAASNCSAHGGSTVRFTLPMGTLTEQANSTPPHCAPPQQASHIRLARRAN